MIAKMSLRIPMSRSLLCAASACAAMVVGISGCRDQARPSEAVQRDTLPASASFVGADTTTFTDRVVVFMEATSDQIEKARGTLSAEDFAVMADDLMFYRSSAYDWLKAQQIPVKTFSGRRSLDFFVRGTIRRLDVTDVPFLDVIVLYDAGREPRVIAPIDIAEAAEYFQDLNQAPTVSAATS
jgi:hypothetical protein